MSKGGGKTQTVHQNADPWVGAQPHLLNLFGRASDLSQGSGISPQTSMFQNRFMNEAQRDPLTDQAGSFLSKTMAGGFSNPYAAGAMGDAMDMAKAKINAQFLGDSSGSSAHKEWLGRGVTAAALPFASQMFENERGRQMQAAGMAPGIGQAEMTRLGQGLQVSQGVDNAGWNQLMRYRDAISGQPGSSSTSSQPLFENKALNALGGGLAGYGLMSGLGTMAMLPTAAPMWGAGAGALLGLLSDVRAKENVEKVGTHEELGVGIYKYNYKGDPTTHMGVMAQEVAEVKPEAVKKGPDGLLRVNYGEL